MVGGLRLGSEPGWVQQRHPMQLLTAGEPARGRQPSMTEPRRVLGLRPLWSTVSCCVWGGA